MDGTCDPSWLPAPYSDRNAEGWVFSEETEDIVDTKQKTKKEKPEIQRGKI